MAPFGQAAPGHARRGTGADQGRGASIPLPPLTLTHAHSQTFEAIIALPVMAVSFFAAADFFGGGVEHQAQIEGTERAHRLVRGEEVLPYSNYGEEARKWREGSWAPGPMGERGQRVRPDGSIVE